MRLKLAILMGVLLLLGGCAGYHSVTLDAISQPGGSHPGRYVLVSDNPRIGDDDLEFKWLAKSVHEALSRRGFTRTRRRKKARLVIAMSYGVSSPEIVNNLYTRRWYDRRTKRWEYETYSTQYKLFKRHMVLKAYKAKGYDTGGRKQLWRVAASSLGVSGDLRQAAPILAAAMEPYFGVSTEKQIEVRIPGDDPRLSQ
jgi:hypothetical protein